MGPVTRRASHSQGTLATTANPCAEACSEDVYLFFGLSKKPCKYSFHLTRQRTYRQHHESQFGPGVAALTVLMSSQVLQATLHIVGLKPGVIYRALHLSRKLFDTTSKGKFPGCPQSIRDIDSLVVKVSKLIHLQTVGEILRLRVQTIHHCVSHS